MSTSEYDLAGTRQAEGLWFSKDPLVVLRAEDTVFRVSGGILSARSTVFRDMLALPQPSPSVEDTIDGCTVVRLPDSATEVESFLRAIFDSNFFMPPPALVDFDVVIGVLRLAHKYDVEYLFRRALSHLDHLYPIHLDKCSRVHQQFDPDDHIPIADRTVSAIVALRAASQVGATWMLPMIYYTITCWSDFERVDLRAATNMSSDEKFLCLAAQTKFVRENLTSYQFLGELPHRDCTTIKCPGKIAYYRHVVEHWSSHCLDANPLRPSLIYLQHHDDCELCRKLLVAADDDLAIKQRKFWEQLPDMFALPGWDELREMRGTVMEEASVES
ncbi:BTB domain-containing protein [Favolaschia claudopus]|uniref:BTB domain-containing protein n=1 Tax=Favolaschia claudopus TaxID=2862362 RepID=A0AAW0EGC2_9AGAR